MFSPLPPAIAIPEIFQEATTDTPVPAESFFPPTPQRYTLIEEVRSHVNPNHIYGTKNSTVTLISQNGELSIVEGPDRDRYTVRNDNLRPLRGYSRAADTSRAAYHSALEDGTIAGQKLAILRAMESHGEGNAYQISKHMGIGKNEVGRRMSDLLADGSIVSTGTKAKTVTGQGAFVYKITAAGRRQIS